MTSRRRMGTRAKAHGAGALAAARCAWGAEGSLGQRPNVPEAGKCIENRIIIPRECNKIQRESLFLQPNSRTGLRQIPEQSRAKLPNKRRKLLYGSEL